MTTAIEIINAACEELGLPNVTISTAGPDDLGPQMFSLLNALGKELLRLHDWQFLEKTMTFTGDGLTDTFPLPDDWFRQINQTQWDKSNRRTLLGPENAQTWGWCNYGLVGTGIFYRYRILANEYNVFPVPADGNEFALYYISKNWVQDGVDPLIFKDKLTGPNDIPLFDERVLISGLKVKLWSIKGLNTTSLQREASDLLASYKAQNQGAPILNLSSNGGKYLIGMENVPEGTYYGN